MTEPVALFNLSLRTSFVKQSKLLVDQYTVWWQDPQSKIAESLWTAYVS